MIPHISIQCSDLTFGDIRRIADDQIELGLGWLGRKQIPDSKLDPLRDLMDRGVLLGDRQRGRTEISCEKLTGGQIDGQRYGHTPRARAQIQNPWCWQRLRAFQRFQHKRLRIWPRNQDVLGHLKIETEELTMPHQIRHRFSPRPAFDQVPHLGPFGIRERRIEVRIELNSGAFADKCEQNLSVQPRGITSVLFQKACRPIENAGHGPHIRGLCSGTRLSHS